MVASDITMTRNRLPPAISDLVDARADREEIKRLERVAKAAEAMLAKSYGVAGGVLCIPPCYEQSEFADAMADLRISNEKI